MFVQIRPKNINPIEIKKIVDDFSAKFPMADEDKLNDAWFFPVDEITEKDLCAAIKSVLQHPKDKIILILSFCYLLHVNWKNIPSALKLLNFESFFGANQRGILYSNLNSGLVSLRSVPKTL